MERAQRSWHPYRRLNLCGLRGTTCVVVLLSLLTAIPIICLFSRSLEQSSNSNYADTSLPQPTRHRRWDREVKHSVLPWLPPLENPQHHYHSNMWWRYAEFTARQAKCLDCYVCSPLPVSSASPLMFAQNLTMEEQTCLMALAVHPGAGVLPSEANFSVPLNITMLRSPLVNSNCSHVEYLAWPQMPGKLAFSVIVRPQILFQSCVIGNGTVPVGDLTPSSCNVTSSFCPFLNETAATDCSQNETCFQDRVHHGAAAAYDTKHAISHPRTGNPTPCTATVPGPKGTRVLSDYYWLCGHSVWISLPPSWGGLCTLIPITGDTFILPASRLAHRHRLTRRSVPVPSVDKIPSEHRLWKAGTKVAPGLLPWMGVGTLQEEVEITRYTLLSFINTSIVTTGAIRAELDAVRLVALQNRLVLDQITAPQGGVCALVGTVCCTYIPDDAGDGGKIAEGINNMTRFRDEFSDDPPDVSSWLSHGGWQSTLSSVVIMILAVLFVLFVLSSCGIPLLRSMITKMMTGVVSAEMVSLSQENKLGSGDGRCQPDFVPVPDYIEDSSDEDYI